MRGDRYCKRCQTYLGNYMLDDYYSLIRKKYCAGCLARVQAEQDADWHKKHRKEQRQLSALKNEQIELLKAENEQLREKIRRMEEELKL